DLPGSHLPELVVEWLLSGLRLFVAGRVLEEDDDRSVWVARQLRGHFRRQAERVGLGRAGDREDYSKDEKARGCRKQHAPFRSAHETPESVPLQSRSHIAERAGAGARGSDGKKLHGSWGRFAP